MNILHIVYDHSDNPWVGGGGAVRVEELSRRLVERGHEVTLLCGRYPGARERDDTGYALRFAGLAWSYLVSTFSFAAAAALYLLRHGGEYDVVIEDIAPWNPVFSPLLTRTPVVGHVNHIEGTNILRRWPFIGLPFYLVDRYYPGLFSYLTVVSEGTLRKVRRPAYVLPNGVPGETILPPGTGGLEDDEGYFLFVGRVEINNKGMDTLVEALRMQSGSRLVVAGRGRDEQKLKDMAAGLDMDFRGFVSGEEKQGLLRRCSALVLPSRFEGWGIVVLEAAACGKPVIVSDILELQYAVKGGFGLSFEKGNPAALAARMQELSGNSDLRQSLGQRARGFVQRYTWEAIALQYEKYLQGIVEKAGN